MRAAARLVAVAAALWFLPPAGPIAAQTLPEVYDVRGVAADDVLNIRARPAADAPVLGSLGPGRTGVEVIEITADGSWGRIGLPEGNGWVAMRYLQRQDWPAGQMPRPFFCAGTEPFWTLGLYPRGDEFVTPEGRADLTLVAETMAPQGVMVTLVGKDGTDWTLLAGRGACSDGMSDRAYGWAAMLFRAGADGHALMSGCCTLDGG